MNIYVFKEDNDYYVWHLLNNQNDILAESKRSWPKKKGAVEEASDVAAALHIPLEVTPK